MLYDYEHGSLVRPVDELSDSDDEIDRFWDGELEEFVDLDHEGALA